MGSRLNFNALSEGSAMLINKGYAWKIRWRMKYDRNPQYTIFSDKYKVKEYAKERGVKTAKALFVTDRPEAIPFDDLPMDCFIKANHGYAWNIARFAGHYYDYKCGYPLFHEDGQLKSEEELQLIRLTEAQVIALCKTWLSQNHARGGWGYRNIPPKIIVEENLCRPGEHSLKNYRFLTFDGEVKALVINFAESYAAGENIYLDLNWQPIPLTKFKTTPMKIIPPKPQSFAEMIDVASRLGKGFDYMRIDLYDCPQGVVLGEITLYPHEGNPQKWPCPKFDKWLGSLWRQKYLKTLWRYYLPDILLGHG